MRKSLMDNTTFDFACAVDFRIRADRYRRLARLYQPDVATVLLSMANDLEAAAATLEEGSKRAKRLRTPFVSHGLAS